MRQLESLEQKLGVRFRDRDLLRQALTHRSYLNENKAWRLGHNERLEFLGDAVIEMAVTHHLFREFPNKAEGELTDLRSSLVRTKVLSIPAEDFRLWEAMLFSRGERKGPNRARTYLAGSAYEAVVGAIYADQGERIAHEFVARTLFPLLRGIMTIGKVELDPKSLFQQEAQGILGVTPSYRILKAKGPDHDKVFIVGAYLGSELVAKGQGDSKKEAETMAAQAALDIKGWAVLSGAHTNARILDKGGDAR